MKTSFIDKVEMYHPRGILSLVRNFPGMRYPGVNNSGLKLPGVKILSLKDPGLIFLGMSCIRSINLQSLVIYFAYSLRRL